MNYWIVSAAALSLLTFFVHVVVGGIDTHSALLNGARGNLPASLMAIISILWHGVSAVLLINSFALYFASRYSGNAEWIVYTVVAQYLSFAVLFIYYGLINTGTLLLLPQWIIFLAISGLAIIGLRMPVATIH